MTEQKCNIYEAKKILGIERGKTYARITKEKREERILDKTRTGKRK